MQLDEVAYGGSWVRVKARRLATRRGESQKGFLAPSTRCAIKERLATTTTGASGEPAPLCCLRKPPLRCCQRQGNAAGCILEGDGRLENTRSSEVAVGDGKPASRRAPETCGPRRLNTGDEFKDEASSNRQSELPKQSISYLRSS
mmetsp:Transcript_9492/g.35539  ORF Transcript_9492/g.35539 Transcript_9492/m.35539 type:complete len:145 (+) Transcript_9492:809-1243(+)